MTIYPICLYYHDALSVIFMNTYRVIHLNALNHMLANSIRYSLFPLPIYNQTYIYETKVLHLGFNLIVMAIITNTRKVVSNSLEVGLRHIV